MNEEFLSYIWKYRIYEMKEICSSDGEKIEVLYPGDRNLNQGPDFLNARLMINGTLWAGNVEIHVKTSDYFRHGHRDDPAYQNLILHVVYENDRAIAGFPCLELKGRFPESLMERYQEFIRTKEWLACGSGIKNVDRYIVTALTGRVLVERLERKCQAISELFVNTRNNWEQTFYILLARCFGFLVNSQPFEMLARIVPYSVIVKQRHNLRNIEAFYFGMAGMLEDYFEDPYPRSLQNEFVSLRKKVSAAPLEKSIWKYHRLRPSNFPDLRLAQFAALIWKTDRLLEKILCAETIAEIKDLLDCPVSPYWNKHYRFGLESEVSGSAAGDGSRDMIIINAIIPFLFFYGKQKFQPEFCEKALNWMEKVKAEDNRVMRRWRFLGVNPANAAESQGLLELEQSYCRNKRCLDCAVGRKLIAS